MALSAFAIRRLPIGRYRLGNTLARLAPQPFLARLAPGLGGARFVCDIRDSIAREVCFTGVYEPQETRIVAALLKPGMIVADVGANWGYFTLLCAHLVGPTGRVIAIEPHPRLSTMLAGNLKVNGLDRIECHRLAAAAGEGRAAFIDFDERGGNWGLSRRATTRCDYESDSVALDALLDSSGCDVVDLVKIDVEGGEADVLRGMADGLRRARYRYVLLECHPAELAGMGSSVEVCLALLRSAGYRGWWIDHSPSMHRRASRRAVKPIEMLRPCEGGRSSCDPWPHSVWAAPDAPAPC